MRPGVVTAALAVPAATVAAPQAAGSFGFSVGVYGGANLAPIGSQPGGAGGACVARLERA
jgi:hypothetical protein